MPAPFVRLALVFLGFSFFATLVSGCHRSGVWQDDPANWRRAFGTGQPSDAVVVHSFYWRSPHWTFEFEYFFHIRANDRLRARLLEAND